MENWDQVFDSHLSQVLLNLLGGPEKTALTPTVKDGESTFVMATPRQRHVREPQPSMRNQTPAQKEKVVKENALQGNAIDENQGWG